MDAALRFALEDRAEKARTATRDAMLGTQALAAAAATSAAGSGCPADGIVAAAIGIAAASAALKAPACVNPEAAIPRMTCWRSSLKNGTPRSKTKVLVVAGGD